MAFRHVRKSSDGFGQFGFGLSAAATTAGAMFLAKTDDPVAWTGGAVLLTLFAVSLIYFARGILFPFELEVVVDDLEIRWGPADSPKQKRLKLSEIVRIQYLSSDCELLANTGSWRLTHIGQGVLMRESDQRRLIDYLRTAFPDLPIDLS